MPEQPGNVPANANALLHQIVKGCFLVLSPVGCWAVIRLVFWVISSPHIFLFFWFLGLGIGKAAEYIIDSQNEGERIARSNQRITSRSRNKIRCLGNSVLAVSSPATQVTFEVDDRENLNDANLNHDEDTLEEETISSERTCQHFNLSPQSTKLLESAAPGLGACWDSKIPKIRKQKCLGRLNKDKKIRDGITKDFLDQNANSFRETEWGTINTG